MKAKPSTALDPGQVRRAMLRARSAVKTAAIDCDRADLHRILAAGYAAAMFVQKEPALADVARGLRLLASRAAAKVN